MIDTNWDWASHWLNKYVVIVCTVSGTVLVTMWTVVGRIISQWACIWGGRKTSEPAATVQCDTWVICENKGNWGCSYQGHDMNLMSKKKLPSSSRTQTLAFNVSISKDLLPTHAWFLNYCLMVIFLNCAIGHFIVWQKYYLTCCSMRLTFIPRHFYVYCFIGCFFSFLKYSLFLSKRHASLIQCKGCWVRLLREQPRRKSSRWHCSVTYREESEGSKHTQANGIPVS